MSIAALNEQLLRAVGVGLALFDDGARRLVFCNDVFETWFAPGPDGPGFDAIFQDTDTAAMEAALAAEGRYSCELSFRRKRRTMVISQTVTRADIGGEMTLIVECQNITRIRELESMIESYAQMVERNTRAIQREKEQVERMLLNILPRGAYEEFKAVGVVAPARYEGTAVLFLDFAGFNETLADMAPAHFVGELNELYSTFDRIGEQFGCERIRTTGDTYLSIAGLQPVDGEPVAAVLSAALRFQRYLERRNQNAETRWQARIGVASGPVLGSVIGAQNYVYDVVGPAVAEASAARRAAAPGQILVGPDLAAAGLAGFAFAAAVEGYFTCEEV